MTLVSIEAGNDEGVTAGPGHGQQAGQDAGDLHEPRERVACQAFHQDNVQHCIVFIFDLRSFFIGSKLQSGAWTDREWLGSWLQGFPQPS